MAEEKTRAAKSPAASKEQQQERPLWILKPTLGARGEGIELLWEPEQVPERGENTVQVRTKPRGLSIDPAREVVWVALRTALFAAKTLTQKPKDWSKALVLLVLSWEDQKVQKG